MVVGLVYFFRDHSSSVAQIAQRLMRPASVCSELPLFWALQETTSGLQFNVQRKRDLGVTMGDVQLFSSGP